MTPKKNRFILVITDSLGVNRAFITCDLRHITLEDAILLVENGTLGGYRLIKKRDRIFLRSKVDSSSTNNLEEISISARKLSQKIKEPNTSPKVSLYAVTYGKYLELKSDRSDLIYLDGIARIAKSTVINRLRPLKEEIISAANKQNIEPMVLTGILIDEIARMGPDDLLDIIGKIGLRDTTVGLAQIKMSTARDLIKKNYLLFDKNISNEKLFDLLNNDVIAIQFAAAYLSFIYKYRAMKNRGTTPPEICSSYSSGLAASISSRGRQIADDLARIASEVLK